MARTSSMARNTNETKIRLDLNIDGTGKAEIASGVGFFDHMMHGFARHGLFDVKLKVDGDLEVDCHHTIEDTGIVLGDAIREAVGDKKASVVMARASCRWMKRLCYVPLTCPVGHIWSLTRNLQRIAVVIWIPKWRANFSTLYPMPV